MKFDSAYSQYVDFESDVIFAIICNLMLDSSDILHFVINKDNYNLMMIFSYYFYECFFKDRLIIGILSRSKVNGEAVSGRDLELGLRMQEGIKLG